MKTVELWKLMVVLVGLVVCVNGAVEAEILQVPAYGTPTVTSSTVLEEGQLYVIEARGTYIWWGTGQTPGDAEWLEPSQDPGGPWIEFSPDPLDDLSILDLLVDGTGYDWLGTADDVNFAPHVYSPSHVYRLYYIGEGATIDLKISDGSGANTMDNSGSLEVEITPVSETDYTWHCYEGHQYALTFGYGTWEDAEAEAVAVGGHLATINDPDENTWVASTFIPQLFRDDYNYLWIGFYQDHDHPDYSEPAGGWVWISGEPVTFPGWHRQEPTNHPPGEDYAFLAGIGGWSDWGAERPDFHPINGVIEISELRCGWIAFSSTRDGDLDIWAVGADGTGLRQLTNLPREERSPQWSPDSTKIVYTTYTPPLSDPEVWVYDWVTKTNTKIYDAHNYEGQDLGSFGVYQAAWSPDGSKILFREDATYLNPHITVINADGTGRAIVPVQSGYVSNPSWSPDGKAFVYDRRNSGTSYTHDLWIYDFTATGDIMNGVNHRLTQGASSESTTKFGADWMPSGDIAFCWGHNLAIIDPGQSPNWGDPANPNVTFLTNDASYPSLQYNPPSWSPDLSQIVYEYYSGGGYDLWIMDASGANRYQLTATPYAEIHPDWGNPVCEPGVEPDIDVSPAAYDFGDVEIGASETMIVSVSNVGDGDLTLNSIVLAVGSSSDFSITSAPALPATVVSGGTIDIEVAFAPSIVYYSSAVLEISSDDTDESLVQVDLGGVGVWIEPPPDEQIEEVLDFIEESVEDESLAGDGPGNSADKRLNALINMIEAAGDLIRDGLYEEAHQQLGDAYKKCDGQSPPPDFVTGPAASDLSEKIQALMDSIIDMTVGRVIFLDNVEDIPSFWTIGHPSDVIRFTGEAANQLRALEEDDHLITIALFAGLQFDGILSSFLASEGSLEQFYLNLVGTPEEALATELSGGTLNLAVSLFQVLQAYSVADNIANSTDDVYIVFPEYPHYETEIEEFYYTGVLFAADDLTGETLGDLSLWVDAVYYESLDEEVINPDGYSLGKANYEFPQGYVPVPNNYEWSILEWKWVAP